MTSLYLYASGVIIVYYASNAIIKSHISGVKWYWVMLWSLVWPVIPYIIAYDFFSNDRVNND